MSSAPRTALTPAQYLAIERAAATRSEFHDGQMFAMSGASLPHNRLVINLLRTIGDQLEGGPCEILANDMRVTIDKKAFVYPDLVIVCGQPELLDEEFDTLVNPRVIAEILSPSTEKWDRGGKFDQYQKIQSLTDYILVTQDKVLVDHFARQNAAWDHRVLTRPGDVLRIDSIAAAVLLADVYRKVILS